jgi:PST family polysaccharide transporter
VLSYSLHPYRPRIDLSQARTLFKFSKWIVLTRVIQYFGERGPDFFIGRFLGPGALGLYRVGHEIATLPTSELIAPIMRAVFPGYASVAHDRLQLVRSFLMVQGMIVMLSLPAGIGIAMLADSLVRAALGQNWLGAVPLIQVLGIYGSLTVFQATSVSIFNVLGVPHWSTVLKTIEVSVLLAAIFAVLEFGAGLQGVVWAVLGSQLLVIPLGMVIIGRLLPIGMDDRLRVIWRPVVAVGAMTGTLALLGDSSWFADMSAISSLAISIPIGAFVFITIVWVLWFISGSPEGTEKTLLTFLGDRIKRKQTMI